ncbi:hypothetical protein CSOJ01_04471 [Colletotrichum sojae]|uniref:Uncharacterized protein n=1 Tax=Colletotrichum sojae TaxID=2175907 RepID=A0A8H6JIP1_9PEZI|nr:hypothetical protein CSOJ01_04471 [Colletotrichum sojae]
MATARIVDEVLAATSAPTTARPGCGRIATRDLMHATAALPARLLAFAGCPSARRCAATAAATAAPAPSH